MSYDNPQSRNEAILQNILGADNVLEPPQSRTEAALTAILNGEEYTGEAKSRVEMLLKEISQQGGGNVDVEALAVDANGTYTAPEGTAYSPVTVNVSGGGGQEVPEKDVNFIDYDGTVLYSYTAQEALALTALPANPSHEGLTAQGWNYTLAEVKTEVNAVGGATVGQMYVTDDGKTRIYISIPEGMPSGNLGFGVRFKSSANNNCVVDWGDGSSETAGSTSKAYVTHEYATPGDYVITLDVTSGTITFENTNTYPIYGSQLSMRNRGMMITAIELGKGITSIGAYAFASNLALKTITIPDSITSMGGNQIFDECPSLKGLVLPPSVSSAPSLFYSPMNSAIRRISIPNSITSFGNFRNLIGIKRIDIPSSVTSIIQNALYYTFGLLKLTIPASVTDIGSSAFRQCGATEYHLLPTTPPTLGSEAFRDTQANIKIYVPAASLETYKTATNWSTWASYMVGE